MKVFVAGSTGVVGRVLVPLLLDRGHEVVGLVRSAQKARVLVDFGAQPVVAAALDARALTAAVLAARPDAIVHHLTALADFTNLKRFDEAQIIRVRILYCMMHGRMCANLDGC